MFSPVSSPLSLAGVALALLAYVHVADGNPVAPQARAYAAEATLVDSPESYDRTLSSRSKAVRLEKSGDGLFYLTARVNGAPVRFLVDTGANLVVLTPQDARRAGVSSGTNSSSAKVETAAGTSKMERVKLKHVTVAGTEAVNVDAAVMQGGLQVSLLGQNMLSKLGVITISGDEIALRKSS